MFLNTFHSGQQIVHLRLNSRTDVVTIKKYVNHICGAVRKSVLGSLEKSKRLLVFIHENDLVLLNS